MWLDFLINPFMTASLNAFREVSEDRTKHSYLFQNISFILDPPTQKHKSVRFGNQLSLALEATVTTEKRRWQLLMKLTICLPLAALSLPTRTCRIVYKRTFL
jgi:hypothetical protein